MSSKVARDPRGNRPAGQITRNFCVYRAKDDNGEMRLLINAPEPESPEVTKVIRDIYVGIMPEDIASDCQRIAMLIRIAKYHLFADSAPNDLKEEMDKMGTKFDGIYHQFCSKLHKFMLVSYEMFEKFKTACLYLDEGKDEIGIDTLKGMQELWTKKAQAIYTDLSDKIDSIEKDAERLITKLDTYKEREQFEACLSKCTEGVRHLRSFLSQQNSQLESMHDAFDLKKKCAEIQSRLSSNTFQQLISGGGYGFLYEIHNTILRCVATKHMSGSYTRELTSKRAFFAQMVSACPTPTEAERAIPSLIAEYNRNFPQYALSLRTKPDPPKEKSFCVLL